RLRAGNERLAETGFAESVSVEDLEGLLGRDADLDLAIVHRLGTIALPESGDALVRIDRLADRDLRKEIKRSLYRLEQRGVVVARPPTEARPLQVAATIEGYVSAFDGRGDRMVWLVKARPGSVLHLFGVVNDPAGLREVAINVLTRRALREILEELRAKHDIRLVAVDWRHADGILQSGVEWARQRSRPIEGDYLVLRAQLTAEPTLTEPSDSSPASVAALPVEERHLVDSAELFAEPELRTWVMAEELAGKALSRLAEIRDSPLVLNEAQLMERFRSVTAGLVEEVFGGEMRPSWGRRCEEMAYYFSATSRPLRACQAAAVAAALRGDRVLAEIPFCE